MGKAVCQVELAGLTKLRSGKVREIFDLGERLLVVATDRISAFDVVLPQGIPDKGIVLTQLSLFWFKRTGDIVPNHLISADPADYPAGLQEHADLLRGRSMLVRRAQMLPIECVVRGYLSGSGWREYCETGRVCGVRLPAGLAESDRLPEPIFTPATKEEDGHDVNISFERAAEIVGADTAARARDLSLALYERAGDYAAGRGIIIADTKFEFGFCDGELVLADEALTPDSSRFWPADLYSPGSGQPSYDKQFVRDYLEKLDWDKTPPAPDLPADIISRTREKYIDALKLLSGAGIIL